MKLRRGIKIKGGTYLLHAVAALDRARVAVTALGSRDSSEGKGRDDSKASEHGCRDVRDGEVEWLKRLRLRLERRLLEC